MQNQEIIKIIENLKGRKNYEQKKAAKLGFPSLYKYFEYKILKEREAKEPKIEVFEENVEAQNTEKKRRKNALVAKVRFIIQVSFSFN